LFKGVNNEGEKDSKHEHTTKIEDASKQQIHDSSTLMDKDKENSQPHGLENTKEVTREKEIQAQTQEIDYNSQHINSQTKINSNRELKINIVIHHPNEGVPHPNSALLEDKEKTIQQQITTP